MKTNWTKVVPTYLQAIHTSLYEAIMEIRSNVPTTASDIGDFNAASVTAVGGKIWFGTQAAYDAIGTKDANTLYVVS